MLDFTVAIPTYNGAERLPQVLEKVRSQIQTESLKWEVIVIDNNSSDNTEEIIENYQETWPRSIPLRYWFEKKQGLAFARQRAIQEARGTYVAFLDDDNLPNSDWVKSAHSFAEQHPHAGAISGQIHAQFEVEPPADFKRIQAFLAIREHGSQPFLFKPQDLRLPPGAGLVIRKQAWIESVPKNPGVIGNTGQSLARGDDYEPLLYMHKEGWEIWYNPDMHLDHVIPHWRLEKDYLFSLARCCGLATCKLLMINAKPWQKPWLITRTILGNSHRIVRHLWKYKGQLKTDLIPAFEYQFYWASLNSPFLLFSGSKTKS
ncbi:glycosyltransferase family 2 protein [Oxynema sp. CENA135]|uniref:hormogonium polysaccharide biosynthesis glycosyltransferase HpsE n=1 Tax=Oxynema sp. CENA135 TaxID=984206 RepID=UPI00190A48C7|nr:hormogonium polysaccharide biosynthesis glycosyltransferase HpsE [Oxynema sp. CENA135]MBK4732787.1 glycosyltransferase family 2 protein [Oxynema sp. CENA135]